jgi:hypothetical protein
MKLNSLIPFILLSLFLQYYSTDYLKNAQHWVDIVYKKIYDVQCKHVSPHPRAFEEIEKLKHINCGSSVSITYQQAGLIDKGKYVCHTPRQEKSVDYKKYYDVPDLKKSISLSFKNPKNFKKGTCDFVKVMERYEKFPEWLKQKGILYVQNSNICISAGKNKIYSCNSSGHVYGEGKSKVLRTDMKHEAAFRSLTLWAVVPRTNGKSNVPSDTPLKHLPCGL